jgi:hypothetical protein
MGRVMRKDADPLFPIRHASTSLLKRGGDDRVAVGLDQKAERWQIGRQSGDCAHTTQASAVVQWFVRPALPRRPAGPRHTVRT